MKPATPATLWFLSLIPIFFALGTPPVTRTQEARVLETAREMHELGGSRWTIPELNGRLRLEKPPLAYWLAAIGFKIGGVNDFAGRAPFAIVAWLTLGVVGWIAREHFDFNACVFAGATLLGSMLFARLGRFAETDGLSTLFITLAIGCMWRAEIRRENGKRFHLLSGVAIGLAVLSKGPPAAFAILFLVGLAAIRRDAKVIVRWLLSGAPLVAIGIGAPWFILVIRAVGYETFKHELQQLGGGEHRSPPWAYLPQLLRAMLPWTGFAIAAIVAAIVKWKCDERARVLLIWCAAIALPLLIARQRQYHYLFPLLPPVALLTGWFVQELTMDSADRRARSTLRWLLFSTLWCLAVGGAALPTIARYARGSIIGLDIVWAVLIILGTVATFMWRPMKGFAVMTPLIVPAFLFTWWPTIDAKSDPRPVATRLVQLSGGANQYCFYGENVSMPLVYQLRTIAPSIREESQLIEIVAREPRTLVLSLERPKFPAPPMPENFKKLDEIATEERTLRVYRAR